MKKNSIRECFLRRNTFKKQIRIMKISILLLMLTISQLHASEVFSQNKVTMNLEKASFREVFREFRKETGFVVLYNNDDFNNTVKIKINVHEVSISNFFKEILSSTGFAFKIVDDNVVLYKSKALLEARQQKLTVSGKITSSTDGSLLIGATVFEKGTRNGVAADFDGVFTIKVKNKESIIVVSYLGYESQEIVVGNKSTINVILKQEKNKLDEIVLIGYGAVSS